MWLLLAWVGWGACDSTTPSERCRTGATAYLRSFESQTTTDALTYVPTTVEHPEQYLTSVQARVNYMNIFCGVCCR